MDRIGMEHTETIDAHGHPNIRAKHKTTLMVTREESLTRRGDCIVAIKTSKGLDGLDVSLKELIRNRDSKITFTLEAGNLSFEVTGRGNPDLPLDHPDDMVVRKSSYVCGRTLMINADKAACDIPEGFVKVLQKEKEVRVTIRAELVSQLR
jgi:hypothetical protein